MVGQTTAPGRDEDDEGVADKDVEVMRGGGDAPVGSYVVNIDNTLFYYDALGVIKTVVNLQDADEALHESGSEDTDYTTDSDQTIHSYDSEGYRIVDDDYSLASDEEWAEEGDGDDKSDGDDDQKSDQNLLKDRSLVENADHPAIDGSSVMAAGAGDASSGTLSNCSIAHSQKSGDGNEGSEADSVVMVHNAAAEKMALEQERFISVLSAAEKIRAIEVFKHCDVYDEGRIDEHSMFQALSLMGVRATEDTIRRMYLNRNQDMLDDIAFCTILGELRSQAVDADQLLAIENAFEALYMSTTSTVGDEQRDALRVPYIIAEDLRRVLVTHGDVLSDEEVDQLIRDCRPKGTKIFFEQFRGMLLPGRLT